jgi:hypothetical protein
MLRRSLGSTWSDDDVCSVRNRGWMQTSKEKGSLGTNRDVFTLGGDNKFLRTVFELY